LLQKETLGEEEIDAIVKGKATALSC
ncbi:MAG: hypothetical protein JG770_1020, partial [Mahella sp.]|nr:hypothetical protein [Mahella sp.]